MIPRLFILLLIHLTACSALRSRPPLEALNIPYILAPPEVNGQLDDPAWVIAPPILLSEWGTDSKDGTVVRIIRDDQQLYIAFSLQDDALYSQATRRDQAVYEDDAIECLIAPFADPTQYVEIVVNAENVLYDAMVYNPDSSRKTMKVDAAWSAEGIEHAVHISPPVEAIINWQVEIAMPISSFGEHAMFNGSWRANFSRINAGSPARYASWKGADRGPPDFHRPKDFGLLTFLSPPAELER